MTVGSDASHEAPTAHRRDRRATVRNLVSVVREYGPVYAVLSLLHRAAAWLPQRIDDRLLTIEGGRGSLGPAHRRWTQHSVSTNREVWSGWAWENRGEEWTASPEWKASLIEHLLKPAIPVGGTVLEIGPGAGRWTEILHPRADRLVLADITDTTLQLCREHLGDPPNVTYVRTDGSSLGGVASGDISAVWAFDTFVHIAPLDVVGYLRDIHRVLCDGGTATIHHSHRRQVASWRSPMSPALFANLARESGLTVVRQFDTWDGGRFGVRHQGDVITQLRRDP